MKVMGRPYSGLRGWRGALCGRIPECSSIWSRASACWRALRCASPPSRPPPRPGRRPWRSRSRWPAPASWRTREGAVAGCGLAPARALFVLAQLGHVDRLSWLDARDGRLATAALAVALGADAGRSRRRRRWGGLGLCRWRPGRTLLLALAGLAALAAGPWLAPVAALAMAAAAWLPEPPPRPGMSSARSCSPRSSPSRRRAVPADRRPVHRHRRRSPSRSPPPPCSPAWRAPG